MPAIHLSLAAMGTSIELVALPPASCPVEDNASRRSRLQERLKAAADWLCLVERTLSRFRPDSELSWLNGAAGRPCLVSPLLIDVLDAALAAAQESDGLYDPTVLPCVLAAGYTADLTSLLAGPASDADRSADWQPGWRQIRLDRRYRLVTLPPGTALDFGGIAKGWAADAICSGWLEDAPLVVDVGGDLRIHLPSGGESGWPVAVADPFQPDRNLAVLRLPSCGVATSSTIGRRWLTQQGWRHHIIDPRTGAPANSDLAQATVVAPTAKTAEAWAKALCILGSKAGTDFLAQHPEATALMVRHDGTCLATSSLEVYLDAFNGEKVSA